MENLHVDGIIILKYITEEDESEWTGWIWLTIRVGCFQNGNEPSGSKE
jgi:hypothetical protein